MMTGIYLLGTINPKTGLVTSDKEIFNNKPLPENVNQMYLDGLLPPDASDMFPCGLALISIGYGNVPSKYGDLYLMESDMIIYVDDQWKILPSMFNLDLDFITPRDMEISSEQCQIC